MTLPFPESGDSRQLSTSRFLDSAREHGFFTLYDAFKTAWQSSRGDLDSSGVKMILQDMSIRLTEDSSNEGEREPSWSELEESEEEQLDEQEEAQAPEPVEIRYEELEGPIAMYLREIDRGPLLSAQQEVDLAKRIERGLKAEEKLKRQGLSQREESRLRQHVQAGQAARRALTEANLRLVVSIAKRYWGRDCRFWT